jgi:hypothetical protein
LRCPPAHVGSRRSDIFVVSKRGFGLTLVLAAAAKALDFLGKRAETLLPPLEQIKPNHVRVGHWIKKLLDR